MVWVAIVVALVMAVVGELLRPKPKFSNPQPSAVGDFSFPTVDASRVIPVWWGTCKMQGPNVTWFGDLAIVTLKKKVKTGWFSSKKIVTGYNYYLGAQLVFGYGQCDEFIELRADDKPLNLVTGVTMEELLYGMIEVPVPGPPASKDFVGDVCSFYIWSPSILSNDDPPSGVKGPCKLYNGSFTQPPNIYLSEQWSEPDMTAFRPLIHLVLEHCYLGNSDTPPPISLIARRCPNQLGLTGGRHNVNGDSNIACAVFEVMTNKMWGMKIPPTKIDIDAFVECGNTLAAEGLGISMLVQNAMLGKDLIAEMLRHADGVVYADPVTGLYTMKLARDDYDLEELIVIDNSNLVPNTFEFSRTSWELTKNTIIVQYTDRTTFETKPVQYQDLANIDVRGGMIDSEEINFLGFSNSGAALNAAARACKIKASPLVSARMSVNRIGYQLRPGSVFILQKPDRGLANIIMRVIEIDYGTLDDPAIKITAMEDIFSIGSVAYDDPGPGDWTPPATNVTPFTIQKLVEAPLFGSEDPSKTHVITLATAAESVALGYDVYTDPTGGTEYVQTNFVDALTPSGTLTGAYSRTGPEVDETGFTVANLVGVADLTSGLSTARAQGENLALIGNEWIAWRDYVNNGDGTFTFKGNWRGVLDTVAEDHVAGDRVWFLSEGSGTTNEEGYGGNVTVRAKLLTKGLTGTVDLSSATSMSLTTNSRASRPFPPGKIRVNTLVPGAAVSGSFTFTWAHRNRFDETVAAQDENSRTPEAGSTYNIYVRRADTNALLVSKTNVSNTASAATINLTYTGNVRVEIESSLAGLVSFQKQSVVFPYTAAGAVSNTITADEASYVLDGGGA